MSIETLDLMPLPTLFPRAPSHRVLRSPESLQGIRKQAGIEPCHAPHRVPSRSTEQRNSPDSSSAAGHEVSGRLLCSDVRGAPPWAPCRALGAVESTVLKLPLPQDQVTAPQRAFDHLAQGAQGLALAVLLLFMRVCGDVVDIFSCAHVS